jgi:signal transduction histidine kinase
MTSLVPFPPLSSADLPEFDISDLLQEVCDALERDSLRRRVPIEVDVTPYTMVCGDRRQLRTLLIRLIGNALSASPAGSQIIVTTYSNEDGVELEVADDRSESVELLLGEGLAAGAGDARPLSWSEVQQIVAGCGAEISVADCPDSGVAMTVHFPRLTGKDGGSRKAA